MPSKVQLTGGAFQDSEGNVLANGYLTFKLSQDGSVGGLSVCSGIEVKILLDANGNVATTPSLQYMWGNDQILPVNTFYRVTGYTAQGQPAWGPNNQQVIGSGGTFDLSTWVPNSVFSWTPPVQPVTFETNGTKNGNQVLLNLAAGTNMSVTDNGSGTVTLAVTGITGITLKTNGVANSSQTLLNLVAGTGITLGESAGAVTITNSAPATGVTAGTNIIFTPSWGTNTVYPENGTESTVNTLGATFFEQISAGMLLCFPTSWKVTIKTVAATTVTMVIVKCTRGTGTIVAQAPVTFGGQSSPVFGGAGKQQSDAINFSIDAGYDYYFALESSSHLMGVIAPGTNQVGTAGGNRISASAALPLSSSLPSWTSSSTEATNNIVWDWVAA